MTFFSILNCTAPASSHLQGRGGRERGERSGEREERERPNREAESRAGGARPAPPLPRRVRPPVAGWAFVILPPSLPLPPCLPDGHFPHAAERHVPSALPSTAGGRSSIRPTPPPPFARSSASADFNAPSPGPAHGRQTPTPGGPRPGREDSIAFHDVGRLFAVVCGGAGCNRLPSAGALSRCPANISPTPGSSRWANFGGLSFGGVSFKLQRGKLQGQTSRSVRRTAFPP